MRSRGGSWLSPPGSASPPTSRLYEGFGGSYGSDGMRGSFFGDEGLRRRSSMDANPSAAASPMDEKTPFEEEVPLSFSMKAQQQFGGLGGRASAASSMPRFGMSGYGAGYSPGYGAGTADFGMGMSFPTGSQAFSAGGAPQGDRCWVTVFGFPGRTASLVRQQLETLCGPIVEVRHGDGNFMHVRFHTAAGAAQCLALNGRAIVGKLLIGCVPCTSGFADGSEGPFGDVDAGLGGEADTYRTSGGYAEPDGGTGGPGSGMGGPPTGPRAAPPPPPASRGPQVTRGGLVWRLVDMLFDI